MRIGDVVALPRAALDGNVITYVAAKTGKPGKAVISDELAADVRRGASKKWLFPSPYKRGQHLTRQAVWARLKRASERAAVDARGVSPHSLRKSYAVRLCRESGLGAVRVALQHERNDTAELYALSDWLTGENAKKALLREDLGVIVDKIIEVLAARA